MSHKSTLSVRVVLVLYQGDKGPCVFRGKFGFRDAYDGGQINPAHILLEYTFYIFYILFLLQTIRWQRNGPSSQWAHLDNVA